MRRFSQEGGTTVTHEDVIRLTLCQLTPEKLKAAEAARGEQIKTRANLVENIAAGRAMPGPMETAPGVFLFHYFSPLVIHFTLFYRTLQQSPKLP